METPTMDTVYQAISALYDNPNCQEKEKASLWLGDIQKSIHSWEIADQLLQQRKDVQSCYFAAQTMRSKVQHNLSELPAESLVSLRDSLICHLKVMSADSNTGPILTQLCLALADLALQMPMWQNCVSELIQSFSNKNDFALLEILTVLPQEIDSSSLKLGENRREEIKAELRANTHIVTLFLKEKISSIQKVLTDNWPGTIRAPGSQVALKIIKCLTSWIQVKAVNIQEVPENAVIGYCLQVLRDYNSINLVHDAASDCICALLHCFEDNNNNGQIERLLFDSVASLEEVYHMAVAHEEEDKAANYARVFTELAETFLEKMIDCTANGSTHFAMRSLELCLVCVGHHDYEVAEITFNLWYRLSEEVYQRDYQPLTEVFKPHIERLIGALARHCQCEPDLTQLPDEGDEFFEFRMKVMELIKDVVFIVGSSAVFRQMFTALQADMSWEQTEAALFIMQSVAKNILPEEYEYVPKVVEAILSMPESSHKAVRKTCIQLLGELCEWIERHPECLEPCLLSLLRALRDPPLAYAAAVALQNICNACRVNASAHAGALLAAARGADELALPPPAGAALLRALAAALGGLPHDQLSVAMREAAGVQSRALAALVAGGAGAGGGGGGAARRGGADDPAVWLDRLAALFRDVRPTSPPTAGAAPAAGDAPPAPHPCLPALAETWPVLEQVMDKYSGDGRVVERLCRCVRFGVRMAGAGALPLLPALAARLAALYAAQRPPAALYLSAVLVDELGGSEPARAPLLALLERLVPQALQLLQRPHGLRDNPDTVDDFFRLCIRFLQRMGAQFLGSEAARAVLQCAALAACLDHREANCSVMKFLYDMARAATAPRDARDAREPQVQELAERLVASEGERLTCALVEAGALHLHAYMLSDVAEPLLELLLWQRAHPAPGRDWLRAALERLPRAPPAPAAPTEHQCMQFYQYAMKAEKCKDLTRLLRDFARLFR